MITVPVSVIVEGAVNTPVGLIVPADALHVTEVCPEAVNVCVAFTATETVAGETVIAAGGFKVIRVTADFVESAPLRWALFRPWFIELTRLSSVLQASLLARMCIFLAWEKMWEPPLWIEE